MGEALPKKQTMVALTLFLFAGLHLTAICVVRCNRAEKKGGTEPLLDAFSAPCFARSFALVGHPCAYRRRQTTQGLLDFPLPLCVPKTANDTGVLGEQKSGQKGLAELSNALRCRKTPE